MKNTFEISRSLVLRDSAMVAIFVGAVCGLSAMSHLIALPVKALNPMLIALVAGLALVRDRRVGYILAVALPFVSCLLTGMPTPLTALCMAAEFATVVAHVSLLENRMSHLSAIVSAIAGGKVVYYLIKAVVISPVALFGTSFVWQLLSVAIAAGLYYLISAKRQ